MNWLKFHIKSNISRWLSSLWLLVPCNVLWQEKFGCVILGPAFRRLLLLLSWCSSLRITVLVFGGIVPTHLDHRSRLRWDCTDTPRKIETAFTVTTVQRGHFQFILGGDCRFAAVSFIRWTSSNSTSITAIILCVDHEIDLISIDQRRFGLYHHPLWDYF